MSTSPSPATFPSPPPLWLLALLTFSGTLAMHMFVPALPTAAAALMTTPAALQGTISLYILGLAAGQLLYGPVSDRFGRRPVLTFGLCLYTMGGAMAALAPDIRILLAARLLQALGGSSGLVLARAIVRDTSMPDTAARRLATLNLMTLLGPGVSPLLGTLLNETLGWRSILTALTLLGIVNLLLVRLRLAETDRAVDRPPPGSLLTSWFTLLRTPAFAGYCLGGGCATTSIYAFIAAAPFILTGQLHKAPSLAGWVLVALLGGMWLGNILTSRLVGRIHLPDLMLRANLLSLVGAALLLTITISGHLGLGLMMGCMMLFTLGVGMTSPVAMTEALSVNPHMAGSASGLYGCSQMVFGALCTTLVGLGSSPAVAAAATLSGATLISQVAFRSALSRQEAES